MNRRDAILTLSAVAALNALAQDKGKAKAAAIPSPSDMKKDRHLLAMMLLLMTRKDANGLATYPYIPLVKTSTQSVAATTNASFGVVDPSVYQQVQAHLSLVAGNPIGAIQNHQQATQSIGMDLLTYPDNQCPFGTTIATAVSSLLA